MATCGGCYIVEEEADEKGFPVPWMIFFGFSGSGGGDGDEEQREEQCCHWLFFIIICIDEI